jgi:hypothetical protein
MATAFAAACLELEVADVIAGVQEQAEFARALQVAGSGQIGIGVFLASRRAAQTHAELQVALLHELVADTPQVTGKEFAIAGIEQRNTTPCLLLAPS